MDTLANTLAIKMYKVPIVWCRVHLNRPRGLCSNIQGEAWLIRATTGDQISLLLAMPTRAVLLFPLDKPALHVPASRASGDRGSGVRGLCRQCSEIGAYLNPIFFIALTTNAWRCAYGCSCMHSHRQTCMHMRTISHACMICARAGRACRMCVQAVCVACRTRVHACKMCVRACMS